MRTAAVIMMLAALTPAAVADESVGRYVIQNGNISGAQGTPPVSILIDSQTGQTWFLGVIDGSPQWLPLVYGSPTPSGTLPPPAR